jgi:hypothetical protein
MNGPRRAVGYVDRVMNDTALVANHDWPGDDYLIVIWRSGDGGWVITHGADVSYRRTLTGATNDALRRLGLDPHDPAIVRTDERPNARPARPTCLEETR